MSFECRRADRDDPYQFILLAAADTCYPEAHSAAISVFIDAAWQQLPSDPPWYQNLAEPADLLRCIFGNPFRPVPFDPPLAHRRRPRPRPGRLRGPDLRPHAVLADALMDAGCDRGRRIDHCRGPGPHVRGCWVVDLVLGKE